MSNKLLACEEFWAMFLDLFKGLRGVAWKNIIGNALLSYATVLTFQMLAFPDVPISQMLFNSLYGAIVGGVFGAGGSIPGKKAEQELEITKYLNKLTTEKHKLYRENMNSITFVFIIELLFWKISHVMSYMVIDFSQLFIGIHN